MVPQLPDHLVLPIQHFLQLLDHWNRTHALTALPIEARFEELCLDACVLLPFLPKETKRIVDFGTGMGIPAVVLALVNPKQEIIAVDKSSKKIAFVRQVALEMNLTNLHPLHGRAESLPPLEADAGVAKAVGSLELLTHWWKRHGKKGHPLFALKNEEESAPTGWALEPFPYELPTRGKRMLLRIESL